MNPAGIVGALNYYEDGITPYMLFFKDGVVSEKFVSTLIPALGQFVLFLLFFPPISPSPLIPNCPCGNVNLHSSLLSVTSSQMAPQADGFPHQKKKKILHHG